MNYNNAGAGAAGTGGMLAITGAENSLWLALAAFALIAAGTALMRIIPRRESVSE